MWHFYLNSVVLCIVIVFSGNAIARSYKDADAVVTLQNGNPCFYYPQDHEIQQRPYSMSFLDVTTILDGKAGWLTTKVYEDKTARVIADSRESCIEYGVLSPGMREREVAKPLLLNTPYSVFIQVSAVPGFERKFATEFCIIRNEKGDSVIVEATGGGRGEWRCLKPGESANRGFWGWLFGK